MTEIEYPGWMCPTCGAWDSGTVMPRRAQWCDGACSHPKVAMEAVSFVRANAYRGAVSGVARARGLAQALVDLCDENTNIEGVREVGAEIAALLARIGDSPRARDGSNASSPREPEGGGS